MSLSSPQQGFVYALLAYLVWGFSPVYFKALQHVPADEILTHRIMWSFIFMLFLITLMGGWRQIKAHLQGKKIVLWLFFSAIVIGGNWLIFIWAINHDRILEASLGYFIAPLLSMVFGILFFKERFRGVAWLALLLVCVAIAFQLINLGTLPLIGLGLAVTMNIYSVIRKKIAVNAQVGMLIETGCLFPIALVYLGYFCQTPSSNLLNNTFSLNLLLASAGILTTIPLLLFTAATTRLPLSTLGFMQYVSPTITFLLAVFIYRENITPTNVITFSLIWLAVGMFVWQSILSSRVKRHNLT